MAITLIVGLGNPDDTYQHNRHNIGFHFVNAIAHLHGGSWKLEKKFFGALASITLGESQVLLLKPTTYMNDSGKSVVAVVKYYSLDTQQVLVAHDELDLNLGTTKLKYSGGHGGHNGLRDISAKITKDYYRLRIGIGRPPVGWEVAKFVLSNPSTKEFEVLIESMLPSIEHIEDIVQHTEQTMKVINTPQIKG